MDRTIKFLITAIFGFIFILALYFLLNWFIPFEQVEFTPAEKEYLRKNSPVRVGVDEEFPPYVFVDGEGEVKGLTIDYLKLIEDKLNLEFEFRACEWEKCVKKLKNKEIDLLNNVTPTSYRSKFMNYTRDIFPHTASVYVYSAIVGINSVADLKGKRVGVRKGTSLIEIVKEYPGIKIITYSKSSELVQALVNQQIEAVVDYDYPFRHALFQAGITRKVKRASESIFREEGTFAVHRDNPQLLSIMERGINLVRPGERSEIETTWLGHNIDRPYYVYLYYEYFPWLLVVGGIIVLLAVWNLTLQRRVQARTSDLQASRQRYKNLFTEAPVSLWVEDFSGIQKKIEQEYDDIDNLEQYLEDNPAELEGFVDQIKVVDVNEETLRLYGAENIKQIRENFSEIVYKENVTDALKKQVIAVARKEPEFAMETTNRTLAGERINIHMKWLLPGEKRGGFSRVFVAISDLTERKRYEQKLEESLQEKETLLQEVHHRVKNNLFTIVSLLEMQRQQSEDDRISAALTEGINRIHTMALIHKNIYRADKFDQINFAGYLKDLVEDLRSSALPADKDIQIKFELVSVELDLDKVIPAALVVNELVTNALGHAYKTEAVGRMKITTSLKEGQLKLQVVDDGRGLPPDFSIEDDASLGLRLVSRLVENQLRGSFSYHSNGQTVFSCKFPV